MREILFRGKKVNKDKWIYGVPVKGTADDESEMLIVQSVFNCEEYFCRGCNFDPVIPETVGQFTGLTDKNGKKIFEGDIVKANHNFYPYKVFVRECKVCIEDDVGNAIRPTTEALQHFECEVIGNIFDNPELLKELQNG